MSYGLVVALVPASLRPGLVDGGQWWRPVVLALFVAGGASLAADFQSRRAPRWLMVGGRLGAGSAVGLIAGGAVAVAIGLGASFSTSARIAEAAAPGAADGLGMLLLQAAYFPNAVVAGVGYVTGLGFHLGAGSYSPLLNRPVDLPAIPLLAAAPGHAGVSVTGVALLAVPVLLALLLGWGVVRRLDVRSERVWAALAASSVAGLLVGGLALLASGGVSGGPWTSTGVAPVGVAIVVALELGAVSVAAAAVARPMAVALPAAVGDDDEPEPNGIDSDDEARENRHLEINESEPVEPADDHSEETEGSGNEPGATADSDRAEVAPASSAPEKSRRRSEAARRSRSEGGRRSRR